MSTRVVTLSVASALASACSGNPDVDPGSTAEIGAGYQPLHAQHEALVAGHALAAVTVIPAPTATPFTPSAPVWPEPSSGDIALPDTALLQVSSIALRVGGLPVRIEAAIGASPPRQLTIESFGRAATVVAGVDGVLLRVSRSDGIAGTGAARIAIGYGAFRWAYGGDWASRLALWALPECALTSPGATGCRATRLVSSNDPVAGTVSAVVALGDGKAEAAGDGTASIGERSPGATQGEGSPGAISPRATPTGTLVMLAAGPSSAGGDYKATSLAPSATWSAGSNTGNFTWTYPLRLPPSLGGPAPKIDIAYTSSSVDGRMAATNNQPSMIGEGFDWQPGSVERRYASCADDMANGANNTEKTGDQCWGTDNASLTLAGHSGELLKDTSNPNLWHLRSDDGTRVERRTGGPNADNDGEYWVAITPDGTQYWFGGRAGSNAALTLPVFGNHASEPCHQTAFKDSACTQAYRWMLDYVVDPFGNTMTYSYLKETNKYAKNNKPEDDTVYDRDGYLSTIEYGTRTDSTGAAPMRVAFEVADRCLSDCGNHGPGWVDTPWDRECTADICSVTQTSPSFWTSKRLHSIKTQVWGGTTYRDVETWTLTHSFPNSDQPVLWLEKISHTGLVGGNQPTPDITFEGIAMPNRVDTNGDQYLPMRRYRMKTITSESGGKTNITYSPADCVSASRMPDPNTLYNNVLRCYPAKWTPDGLVTPISDFFHKYVVTDVVEADLSGSSTRVITHYDYVGDPAWHYTDDDGFIKADMKTWSQWRGYPTVRTTKGDAGEQTREERRYFRGMHGDKAASGTRTVIMPAIEIGNVPAINDEDAFAGQVRETIAYNGPGGAEVSATVNEPYQSQPTATRTINGSTVSARHIGTAVVHNRVNLDGGRGYRTTASTTTFDQLGMPIQIDDRGDELVTGDERCSQIDYVRNTTAGILDRKARERIYATSCSRAQTGGLTDDDIISDTQTSYDGQAWGIAPIKGAVTKVETLGAYNAGSPTFIPEHSYSYDSYGRVQQSIDIRGNRTTTAYQPATGGPVTSTTETNQLGWQTSVTYEPAWGSPVSTTDANARKVDFDYDPLGRLISVWLPNRDRASSPSIKYEYLLRNNGPTVITTRQLNAAGGYVTIHKLLDGLMRERQTQAADGAGGPGAMITDVFYDSANRPVKLHDRYLAATEAGQPVAPSTNLFVPVQTIPRLRVTQYDGVGRKIADIVKVDGPPASSGGTEKWRTTTAYGGDRTDLTPPMGDTPTSTVTDARGNTIELRHYQSGHAAGSSSGFDRTTYTYNRKQQLASANDSAGNRWQYTYDLRGHRLTEADPDKGGTTRTYSVTDDVLTSTDSRGVTLAYTYDVFGRRTSLRDGSATGPKRVEWIYDQLTNGTTVNGQLVKTIRYQGADQYIKDTTDFTLDYKPVGVSFTVPGSALSSTASATFSYAHNYNQDGSTAWTRLPATGDLGLEQLSYDYNSLGKPTALSSSLGATLVAPPDASTPATEYTNLGELGVIHLRHNRGPRAAFARYYDTGTRRLSQLTTARETGSGVVADVHYSYDEIGNVTQLSDRTAGDHQCFATDYMRRIVQAWTPASGDCTPAPSVSTLGGPAAYLHNYSYDALGNRTRLQELGTPTGTRETTYAVPPGAHKLTATSTVDSTGTENRAYSYDTAGNLLTRPGPTGTQTLTWDAEGHLASVQDTSGTTSYVYDVDGNRLLRIDPNGKTLYLPAQELRTAAGSASKTTRYYNHAGETIAMRTASGVTWLSSDHHGTARIAITAVGQAAAIRHESLFGELRGTTGTWPAAMDKGFVGGTIDATGLVHLGAREYDPQIGRFISVDPVIDHQDPQGWHGFAYSNNNPATSSDPGGMKPCIDECDEIDARRPYRPAPAQPAGPMCSGETPEYCHPPGTNTLSPLDVVRGWAHGALPRKLYFRDGDPFTEMLKDHWGMQAIMDEISYALGHGKVSDTTGYSLSGAKGVLKYVMDTAQASMGNDAGFVMGSYTVKWRYLGTTRDGNANIEINVTNRMSIESGTRPPRIGYTPWWHKLVGEPFNQLVEGGPMQNVDMSFRWRAEVPIWTTPTPTPSPGYGHPPATSTPSPSPGPAPSPPR